MHIPENAYQRINKHLYAIGVEEHERIDMCSTLAEQLAHDANLASISEADTVELERLAITIIRNYINGFIT